ncbi:hypothetical protein J2R96_008398 [Bradyrhizobium elkanii]|nr:hypothetical protein [Bradyrhizobium elkanii]
MTEDLVSGAVFSIAQKKDANGKAKAKRALIDLLRSDYKLTRQDQLALANLLDERKRGRPAKNPFSPVSRAVRAIREYQSKGFKRSQAIARYRIDLQARMGLEEGEGHFEKYWLEIEQELRRAKPREKDT